MFWLIFYFNEHLKKLCAVRELSSVDYACIANYALNSPFDCSVCVCILCKYVTFECIHMLAWCRWHRCAFLGFKAS